ncbi:MAG: hypothetical protein PHI85_01165 [Victivallaceae bacterium]|nr:hypothetical protein [Victivallaceae bacterium]
MAEYEFFTCFDFNYAATGITLYRSLKKLGIDFRLHVCTLDNGAFKAVSALAAIGEKLNAIPLAEVERFDPEFAACRHNRSRAEYIFTLSPVLPRYIFSVAPDIGRLAWLDADLFFYASPEPLFREFESCNAAVLLMEHGFPPHLMWRLKYGRFNVEFQIYRRGSSFAALDWWRRKCLDWCGDVPEPGRFADQKYLDEFPEKFSGVIVGRDPRFGIAPWNWPLRPCDDPGFYHFQGFRFITRHLACSNLGSYGNRMPEALLTRFYRGYAAELIASRALLRERCPELGAGLNGVDRRTGRSRFRELLSALKHRNLMVIK